MGYTLRMINNQGATEKVFCETKAEVRRVIRRWDGKDMTAIVTKDLVDESDEVVGDEIIFAGGEPCRH